MSTEPDDHGQHLESSIILLHRARDGDQFALDALYRRYYPRLRRWATGRLSSRARDLQETGDIVNEVMVAFLGQLKSFEPRHPGSIAAYLRMSIYSKIVDADRKSSRRPQSKGLSADESGDEDLEIESPAPSPLEEFVARETVERYEKALRRLKPEEREVVILRLELAYDWDQVAEELGKPSADAARMFFNRAVVKLAEEMGQE